MDHARVVEHDTGPARRPPGRRRWILALALAALAAPLASGSAIAVSGTAAKPALKSSAVQGGNSSHLRSSDHRRGHGCREGKGGRRGVKVSRGWSGYGPEL